MTDPARFGPYLDTIARPTYGNLLIRHLFISTYNVGVLFSVRLLRFGARLSLGRSPNVPEPDRGCQPVRSCYEPLVIHRRGGSVALVRLRVVGPPEAGPSPTWSRRIGSCANSAVAELIARTTLCVGSVQQGQATLTLTQSRTRIDTISRETVDVLLSKFHSRATRPV